MAHEWLRGVFAPIPTAFAGDGEVATPPGRFLEHLAASGLDGVVALGSNGEAAHLTDQERLKWLLMVRAALPARLRLIAGTGAQSTAATIESTVAAADTGADAALVITPSYFRRHLTAAALRAHYEAVATASPVPVLIYNVPAYTGFDVTAEWVAEIAGHPNLVGLKESSGDLSRLSALRARLGPGFIILAGAGERLAEALAVGADGAIAALANLAPRECAAIRRAMGDAGVETVRSLQARIAPLGEALTKTYGVPGLKTGLRLQGYDHGQPRVPLEPLGPDDESQLRALMDTADLLPNGVPS